MELFAFLNASSNGTNQKQKNKPNSIAKFSQKKVDWLKMQLHYVKKLTFMCTILFTEISNYQSR